MPVAHTFMVFRAGYLFMIEELNQLKVHGLMSGSCHDEILALLAKRYVTFADQPATKQRSPRTVAYAHARSARTQTMQRCQRWNAWWWPHTAAPLPC